MPLPNEAAGRRTAHFRSPVAVKPSGMQLSESSTMPSKLYRTLAAIVRCVGPALVVSCATTITTALVRLTPTSYHSLRCVFVQLSAGPSRCSQGSAATPFSRERPPCPFFLAGTCCCCAQGSSADLSALPTSCCHDQLGARHGIGRRPFLSAVARWWWDFDPHD